MEINEILSSLSEEQRKAVTTTNGYIRLVAGAGSGKTSALTKRVAYICMEKNIAPERILSLTFTNKAAQEMRERVSKLINVTEDSLQMMTFHRLALDICKKHLSKIGYPVIEKDGEMIADINIGSTPVSAIAKSFFELHKDKIAGLTEEEEKAFTNAVIRYTKSIINRHNYVNILLSENDELADVKDVLEYEAKKNESIKEQEKIKRKISNLRSDIKEHYAKDAHCYEFLNSIRKFEGDIYDLRNADFGDSPTKTWAKELLKNKVSAKTLDFDDIIMFADYLLTNYDDVREYWQELYDYIQVDEFQDTDYVQLHILKLLSEKHGNLFMVGDPDQSIYMFRGVKPEIFNTLDERFDSLQTIYMENNYRSANAVIESANAIIKLNRNRLKKKLKFHSGIENMEAPLICAGNGSYTAAQLEFKQIQKMLENGVNPNDICILYRDKNCDLTDELVRYLRETDIPLDCQYNRTTFEDTFKEITLNILKYRYSGNSNFLGNFIDLLYGEDYTEVFDSSILDSVPYEGGAVFDTIESLYPKRFTKAGAPTGKYKKFFESSSKIAEVVSDTVNGWNALTDRQKKELCSEDSILNTEQELADGIHIITMHKSKGLEFDYVFVHMDDGMCPKVNNFTNLDSLEEDVRLAYVAVTRARKQVYLCFQNTATISPFAAMSNNVIEPIHAKSLILPDKEENGKSVQKFFKLLDCYYMLNEEGIYTLKNNNTIVGYRYATMINGSRVYFQSYLKDIINDGVVVDDKKDSCGDIEVMMKDDKILAYEEVNHTADVYTINDKELIKDLFEKQNPIMAINRI